MVRANAAIPGDIARAIAYAESFNGRFREGRLDQQWFSSLLEAKERIDAWRVHYNDERPHSSLGYLAPSVFAERAA